MKRRNHDLNHAELTRLRHWCAVAGCDPDNLTQKSIDSILRVVHNVPSDDRTPDRAVDIAKLLVDQAQTLCRGEYEMPNWTREVSADFVSFLEEASKTIAQVLETHRIKGER